MLTRFTLLTALSLAVFCAGCSETTEIFISEINIFADGDDLDDSGLIDGVIDDIPITIPLDDLPVDIWGEDPGDLEDIDAVAVCPVTGHPESDNPPEKED